MISPIEANGVISRAQDISMIRQNEEDRAAINHSNFQQKFDQEVEQNIRTVRQSDDSAKADTRHDAREKGKNEYTGDGGKKKKRNGTQDDGKVVVKSPGGFDIKI